MDKPSVVYYNLCKLLDDSLVLANHRYIQFKCFFGSFLSDITSYDSLYHKYGKAIVDVDGRNMNLSFMIKSNMLGKKSFCFRIDKSSVIIKEASRNLTIAKNLDDVSLKEGLKLFKNRNSIKNRLDKAVSARNLKGLLASKFGVYVQDVYRTSLPSFINIHKKVIGSIVSKCMLNMGIDKCFASYVAKRISISVTSSYESAVRDLLDNSNLLAKRFRLDTPFIWPFQI